MYISRIVVRCFRSFQLLDVSLSPGATCIVGENNTGKSNLVHAIRLALDATMSSYHRQLNADDFPIGTDIRSPQQVIVCIEFSDFANTPQQEAMVADWIAEDDKARLTYRFRPRRSVRQAIAAEEHPGNNLTIDDYGWELCGGGGFDPHTIKWNKDCANSARLEDLQQAFLVVLMKPLRDVESELRQFRSSPLARLLAAKDLPPEEQAELVGVLDEANQKIESTPTIQALGQDITDAFDDVAGEAFRMAVQIGMASASFSDISRALTVLLSNSSMTRFDPSRNGLGLNNVLYISMLLKMFEQRMAAAQTAGQLLLIEEPEAHLHPQLQRVLYRTLSTKSFQTISTTHSTHITSQIPLRCLVVLTNDGSTATASHCLSAHPSLGDAQVQDLERYLDATRATLLFARRVMLVEGPAELFLIPALVAQVRGVTLDALGITIVPIYGIHFDVYARLFGVDCVTKRCAIVADGDLLPSDADGGALLEEDISGLHKPNLNALENDFVKVFTCYSTFERAVVTTRGTLAMFGKAAVELGAKKTGAKLLALDKDIDWTATRTTATQQQLSEGRDLVLGAAKALGKARFAQVACKYVDSVTVLPKYIREAVDWLVSP